MRIKQKLMVSAVRMASALRGIFSQTFRSRLNGSSLPKPVAAMSSNMRKSALPNEQRSTVLDHRADIHAELGQAARLGYVPDAHVYRLHANHVEELDEDRQELGQLEAKLLASLRRLAAMFPEPPAPEPEPTPAAPARRYQRASSMFDQRHPEVRY